MKLSTRGDRGAEPEITTLIRPPSESCTLRKIRVSQTLFFLIIPLKQSQYADVNLEPIVLSEGSVSSCSLFLFPQLGLIHFPCSHNFLPSLAQPQLFHSVFLILHGGHIIITSQLLSTCCCTPFGICSCGRRSSMPPI